LALFGWGSGQGIEKLTRPGKVSQKIVGLVFGQLGDGILPGGNRNRPSFDGTPTFDTARGITEDVSLAGRKLEAVVGLGPSKGEGSEFTAISVIIGKSAKLEVNPNPNVLVLPFLLRTDCKAMQTSPWPSALRNKPAKLPAGRRSSDAIPTTCAAKPSTTQAQSERHASWRTSSWTE
jgi:hypothetical protein